ncbi:hypothetical protein GCM10027562_29050 [Arthrobacter pigmenti]
MTTSAAPRTGAGHSRTGSGGDFSTKRDLKQDAAAGTTAQPKPAGTAAGLLKSAARQLLHAGTSKLAMAASNKIDSVADKLNDVAAGKVEDPAADGGPQTNAGLDSLQAVKSGKNPMWAALKGAWSGRGAVHKRLGPRLRESSMLHVVEPG